jgi:hypothetical protein
VSIRSLQTDPSMCFVVWITKWCLLARVVASQFGSHLCAVVRMRIGRCILSSRPSNPMSGH